MILTISSALAFDHVRIDADGVRVDGQPVQVDDAFVASLQAHRTQPLEVHLASGASADTLYGVVRALTKAERSVQLVRDQQQLGPLPVRRATTSEPGVFQGYTTDFTVELNPTGWRAVAFHRPRYASKKEPKAEALEVPVSCAQLFEGAERTACVTGEAPPDRVSLGGSACHHSAEVVGQALHRVEAERVWVEIQQEDPLDRWWRGLQALAAAELELGLHTGVETVQPRSCKGGLQTASDVAQARAAKLGALTEDPGLPARGVLEQSVIAAVIKQHIPSIQRCYQHQLKKDARLQGSLAIHFTIEPDGTVPTASVVRDDMPGTAVQDCVAHRFTRMRFPRPRNNGKVIVTYPLVFTPR